MSVEFSVLKGKTFDRVYRDDEEIVFEKDGKRKYVLRHEQNCCESVVIDDICGNLSDLENSEILMAEEATNADLPAKNNDYDCSHTWTFYKLATAKGYVDIRFYGTSNGYYSEDALLYECDEYEQDYKPVFFKDIVSKIKDQNKTVIVLEPDRSFDAYLPHTIKEVKETNGQIAIILES